MSETASRRALTLQLIGAMQRERAGLPESGEAPEVQQRRRQRRYHYPVLAVHAGGARFHTHDWSLSGMRVLGVHAAAPSEKNIPVQIGLLNDPLTRYDAQVVIVRTEPRRELAGLKFETFSRPCYDFLRRLEQSIINGQPLR